MLGERRAAILRLIIEYYIKTGEPIGSKTLCNLLPYAVSSATIRNEMAHLSNLGYLEQRHTSGGRVPGKNAYRFYVDHLMEPKALSPYETAKIDERLSVNAGDAQRLLADAADLLADATHCAAFSCALADAYDVIQGVQLISPEAAAPCWSCLPPVGVSNLRFAGSVARRTTDLWPPFTM